MRNIRTGSIEPGFSGLTLVQDWSGNNPGSYVMEGGKLITPNSSATGRVGSNSNKYAIITCVTVNYYYSVNGGPWQFNFSNQYCSGSAGPDSPGGNGSGDWQELPPPEDGGGGGGGSTTPGNLEPPPVVLRDIRDSLKSPCLSQTLAELSMGKLTNYVAQLLKTCFESDMMIEANFSEAPSTEFPDLFHDGITNGTDAGGGPSDPARFLRINTKINTAIASGSKEYVSATIIHEIIHGYFKVLYGIESTNPWDHGQMVGDTYFNQMKYALQEMFPNLSDIDAQALVWIGLQDTDQYKNKPLSEKNAIEYLAMNYRVGISGTKCP